MFVQPNVERYSPIILVCSISPNVSIPSLPTAQSPFTQGGHELRNRYFLPFNETLGRLTLRAGQDRPLREKGQRARHHSQLLIPNYLLSLIYSLLSLKSSAPGGGRGRFSYSSTFKAMWTSSSCFCSTALGAPIIKSWAFLFMGKVMTSRMLSSPVSSIISRSTPGAAPAWGGAP